jgi:hypothetical protein
MSTLKLIHARISKSALALHEDEEGINTLELVLILCVAATLLAVAYKFLWGNKNEGLVATGIKNVTNLFFGIFTGNTTGADQ